MNYFLVDYENITELVGLRGSRYLGQDDCLIIFYSQSAIKMRNDVWQEITKSGCVLKMYKLVNPRKNALDFYIASEAAVLYERSERQIALISRDKDLTSVAEFLNSKDQKSVFRIVRTETLEEAISHMHDPAGKERRGILADAMMKRNLDNAYAAYKSELSRRDRIREAFDGEGLHDEVEKITDLVESGSWKTQFQLYNHCRHEFGDNKGKQIYGTLKEILI